MEISDIYVHDGRLLRVVEDAERDILTMEVDLPKDERSNDLIPRLFVFDDACGYQVFEGPIKGCPAILDMQVRGWMDIPNKIILSLHHFVCSASQPRFVVESELQQAVAA